MTWTWVLISFAVGTIMAAVVGVLIKEKEGWIGVLPHALLRLVCLRAPVSQRADLYDEWDAELHAILHQRQDRPLTRLAVGFWFAASLLWSAATVAAELGDTRTVSAVEVAYGANCAPIAIAWQTLVERSLYLDENLADGPARDTGLDVYWPLPDGRRIVHFEYETSPENPQLGWWHGTSEREE